VFESSPIVARIDFTFCFPADSSVIAGRSTPGVIALFTAFRMAHRRRPEPFHSSISTERR
jgi:hypothetical protein